MVKEKRLIDEPGCLDRLAEYGQGEITSDISEHICDIKAHDDCPAVECDECPIMDAMCQLEYDIQTEVIQFAKDLIKAWATDSVEK